MKKLTTFLMISLVTLFSIIVSDFAFSAADNSRFENIKSYFHAAHSQGQAY